MFFLNESNSLSCGIIFQRYFEDFFVFSKTYVSKTLEFVRVEEEAPIAPVSKLISGAAAAPLTQMLAKVNFDLVLDVILSEFCLVLINVFVG
jgi:hypothetical protein